MANGEWLIADCGILKRQMGRNGEGENLKLRDSDCGIQRVRRGDKGIRRSFHQDIGKNKEIIRGETLT